MEAPSRRTSGGFTVISAVCLTVLLWVPAFAFPDPHPEAREREVQSIDSMEVRAAVLSRGISIVETYYEDEVAPVERILAPYHDDASFVREVSVALVVEGERAGMDPRALASVLLVENPWLDPHIRSFVGAVGLMQVMPFHAGRWGCEPGELTDIRVNICHGARIFSSYLERYGDLDRALLAYNGCVRGTNTPDCFRYPAHVYSQAGRAAMRYWLDPR